MFATGSPETALMMRKVFVMRVIGKKTEGRASSRLRPLKLVAREAGCERLGSIVTIVHNCPPLGQLKESAGLASWHVCQSP